MTKFQHNEMHEIAPRQAFGEALLEIGEVNPKVVVVSCDLSGATKTKPFGQRFPKRFFELGIAEQNGISVASGLAMEGFRPFISSFGAFISRRAYDQIMISAAYNNAKIVIVGTHAGLAIGKDGGTQMGISDINVMKGIPGLDIFQPSDAKETKQIVHYLSNNNNLAYLRLSRKPRPLVTPNNYEFNYNKSTVLKEGNDISIFATGDSVYHSLESAKLLENKGIEAAVINVSTLKPIDKETIIDYAKKTKGIVSVEDASVIGGLGSSISDIITDVGLGKKVIRIGIQDCFGESGDPDDLYRKHKLDTEGIYKTIKNFYSSLF